MRGTRPRGGSSLGVRRIAETQLLPREPEERARLAFDLALNESLRPAGAQGSFSYPPLRSSGTEVAVPRSGYIAEVRQLVGNRRLLVASVTLCIFDARGRLLLLRHDDGDLWSTPGGTIEPDEMLV